MRLGAAAHLLPDIAQEDAMPRSLFDSLLSSARDLTQGQGSADLARRAKDGWNSQSALTKGAIAGGLLGLLLSGNGRRLVRTGAKVGGAALIGGLAYKAWQDWQAGKVAGAGADSADPGEMPDSSFLPPDAAGADDLAHRLLQAMIAAAKADGQITPEERARIHDALPQLGLGAEAQALVEAELDRPLDLGAVAALALTREQGAEIYAASLLAINPEGAAEKGYLALLAARLGLDPGLVDHLNARARALA